MIGPGSAPGSAVAAIAALYPPGHDFGASDWTVVSQELIDAFATLSGDRQFIHIDPERAAQTPFKGTVAHGLLSLALLGGMGGMRLGLDNHPAIAMTVNYGFDRVRFLAPVPVGARVRGCFKLSGLEERPHGQCLARYEARLERQGATKPALIADWLILLLLR
jgi:acyl dehydratase